MELLDKVRAYHNLKKMKPLVYMVALVLSLGWGCAANKTELIPIPPSRDKGSLHIMLTPLEDMSPDDIKFLKKTLAEQFAEAGYDPVTIGKKREKAGTELGIKVEKYEQTKSGTGCVVVSAGCTYICPCVAPCLLFPRYSTTKFNIVAKVEAHHNGRTRFSERFSEEGQSSSSLVEGTEAKGLKEVALNNTVAKIIGKMNE